MEEQIIVFGPRGIPGIWFIIFGLIGCLGLMRRPDWSGAIGLVAMTMELATTRFSCGCGAVLPFRTGRASWLLVPFVVALLLALVSRRTHSGRLRLGVCLMCVGYIQAATHARSADLRWALIVVLVLHLFLVKGGPPKGCGPGGTTSGSLSPVDAS